MFTFPPQSRDADGQATYRAGLGRHAERVSRGKGGTYYELIADALKKRNVIQNLEQLLETAQKLGYYIIHSPHWYYPTDLQWNVPPGAIADYLISGSGSVAARIRSIWKASAVRGLIITSHSRSI